MSKELILQDLRYLFRYFKSKITIVLNKPVPREISFSGFLQLNFDYIIDFYDDNKNYDGKLVYNDASLHDVIEYVLKNA